MYALKKYMETKMKLCRYCQKCQKKLDNLDLIYILFYHRSNLCVRCQEPIQGGIKNE